MLLGCALESLLIHRSTKNNGKRHKFSLQILNLILRDRKKILHILKKKTSEIGPDVIKISAIEKCKIDEK